jgi:hypothetical protein
VIDDREPNRSLKGVQLICVMGDASYGALQRLDVIAAEQGLELLRWPDCPDIEPDAMAVTMRSLSRMVQQPIVVETGRKQLAALADIRISAPEWAEPSVWFHNEPGAVLWHLPPIVTSMCQFVAGRIRDGRVRIDRTTWGRPQLRFGKSFEEKSGGEISLAHVHARALEKRASLGDDAAPIRRLVKKYAPRMSEIPAELRRQFLSDLRQLH